MRPSSTFSSENAANTRSGWLTAICSILAVLVGVALVDLGLRWLAPFELHDDWEHQQVAYKEAKFRSFVRSRSPDAVLVGSSVIMDLNARALSRRVRGRIFNGGIGSGNPTVMGALLEHMYLPLAKPKLIVYAVSARDLRDTADDPFDQAPFHSHRMRAVRAETWQERVEVAVERYSNLFRVRRQLRDLAHRGELPKGVEIKTDNFGSRRYKPRRLVSTLKGRDHFPADYAYRSRYSGYRIDLARGHARQLIKSISRNKRRGIASVLVNVPLSPAGLTLLDRPEAEYRLYLETLRKVARRTGIEFHDAHTDLQLSDADFYDADHLAGRGARKLERYLAPIIAKQLGRRLH